MKVTNTPRLESAKKPAAKVEIDKAAEIVSIGGGYYELPDGRSIRGKKAALKALGQL